MTLSREQGTINMQPSSTTLFRSKALVYFGLILRLSATATKSLRRRKLYAAALSPSQPTSTGW